MRMRRGRSGEQFARKGRRPLIVLLAALVLLAAGALILDARLRPTVAELAGAELESIINDFLFGVLDGTESITAYIGQFWEDHAHKLNQKILHLVEPEDVIISASPIILIQGIREMINTENIIGTEIDLEQKKVIWFNFGDNKVKRYRSLYGNRKIDAFYTDSYNDKDMMDIAKKVCIVKKGNIYKIRDRIA